MPGIEKLRKTYMKLIDLIDETEDPELKSRLIESARTLNKELKEAHKYNEEAQRVGDLLDQALLHLARGKAETDKARIELQAEKVQAIRAALGVSE